VITPRLYRTWREGGVFLSVDRIPFLFGGGLQVSLKMKLDCSPDRVSFDSLQELLRFNELTSCVHEVAPDVVDNLRTDLVKVTSDTIVLLSSCDQHCTKYIASKIVSKIISKFCVFISGCVTRV
jgi:hypothetical protein